MLTSCAVVIVRQHRPSQGGALPGDGLGSAGIASPRWDKEYQVPRNNRAANFFIPHLLEISGVLKISEALFEPGGAGLYTYIAQARSRGTYSCGRRGALFFLSKHVFITLMVWVGSSAIAAEERYSLVSFDLRCVAFVLHLFRECYFVGYLYVTYVRSPNGMARVTGLCN